MKYSRDEYENLLDIAINRANNALKNFLGLLDLDYNLFNNLFNTDIRIDYDMQHVDKDEFAICILGNSKNNPRIYVGLDYMDDLIDSLSKKSQKQRVINCLAGTIIHELLHVNRNILIKEKLNIDTIKCLTSIYSKNNEESVLLFDKDDENIKMYDGLLDQTIKTRFYDLFDNYVPLRLKNNFDNTYDIVAYSKKRNSYMFFNNAKLLSTYGKKNTMLMVGLELNSSFLTFKPSYSIDLRKDNINDIIHDPADYFSYDNLSKNKTIYRNQISFEETLVETFARIIIYLRKDKNINFDKLQTQFDNCKTDDIKQMFKIIRNSKTDLLKWFILSCRCEYYSDEMKKLFGEKYDILLEMFNKICSTNVNNYTSEDITNLDNVINEKTSSMNIK